MSTSFATQYHLRFEVEEKKKQKKKGTEEGRKKREKERERERGDDDDFIQKCVLPGNKPTKKYEKANAQVNVSGVRESRGRERREKNIYN